MEAKGDQSQWRPKETKANGGQALHITKAEGHVNLSLETGNLGLDSLADIGTYEATNGAAQEEAFIIVM